MRSKTPPAFHSSSTRVFVMAFACEPNRGSEPGVGYYFAEALARLTQTSDFEIILLTRPHTSAAVEEAISQSIGQHTLRVEPVKIPMLLVALTKRKRVRIAYVLWQIFAVLRVRQLTRRDCGPFIVHHVTFATEALPTFEHLLGKQARRVFGPSGTSQDLIESECRGLIASIRPFVRRLFGQINLRGVALTVASNDSVERYYARLGAEVIVIEPNIVVDAMSVTAALKTETSADAEPYEIVCVSLLLARKRIHLALEAMALMQNSHARLLVIGDGPLEGDLRRRSVELGLEDRVSFAGKVPRDRTLRFIAQATVLLHPSRQEGSGWVVGEAQAVGTVPVVVAGSGAETAVRLGGLGIVVDNSASALAKGTDEALRLVGHPTDRWNEKRLPTILEAWYQRALTR
ncbi:GDP-mannose-dependent alpha-(1-6)-phosphatidylinositol monomannoside mannosyltransferase [Kocuria rosea]|nr:GDP-mannose-dependent alpha-(1-6)-phosphatidylinositol monomannoside mannosyltransferase [Kocuria rosea]